METVTVRMELADGGLRVTVFDSKSQPIASGVISLTDMFAAQQQVVLQGKQVNVTLPVVRS